MATYTILIDDPPYYVLQCEFRGLSFKQYIFSTKTGQELADLFQSYVNNYESEYISSTDEVVSDQVQTVYPNADWKRFKLAIMQNSILNEAIANAIPIVTTAALAIPAALLRAEDGKVEDLENCWDSIREVSDIDSNTIDAIVDLAVSCNLPPNFVEILS
jgi:hypothetical protein